MDNIQLYYIDNEINKIDKMKQGDVIYKNGVELLVVLSSETDVETKSDQDEENYKETILEQEYIINTICDDLEREGYSVQPIIVPACGVGAPHKRYRIWFIASDCSDARVEGLRQGREDKILVR